MKLKFPICYLTPEEIKNNKIKQKKPEKISLAKFYTIKDAITSLERLRQYQLQDLLGKYKIF